MSVAAEFHLFVFSLSLFIRYKNFPRVLSGRKQDSRVQRVKIQQNESYHPSIHLLFINILNTIHSLKATLRMIESFTILFTMQSMSTVLNLATKKNKKSFVSLWMVGLKNHLEVDSSEPIEMDHT